jgi:MFS family permease
VVPPLGARAWRLIGCVLLFEIGTGMTLPITIVFLHDGRGLSLAAAGLALAVAGAAGLIGTVAAGLTADRFGAGRTCVSGLALACAGTLGFLAVHSLGAAVLAASFQGAGFGITWVGMFPLLIRAVDDGRREDLLGVNYGSINLGLGIGSLGAGTILAVSPDAFGILFVTDAATYVLFAVLLIGLGELHDEPRGAAGSAGISAYGPVVRDTRLLAATAISLVLVIAGYSQLTSAFPAWATGPAGVSRSIVGFAFAANTWAIVVAQLPVLRIVRHWRRTSAVAVTGIVFGASWLVVLAAGETSSRTLAAAGLIAGAAVFGAGETFLSPSLPAIVNRLTGDETRGRYVAFYSLSWQAGPMIGPLISGAALGAGHGKALFLGLAAACALAAPAALAFDRVLPASVNRTLPGIP